MVWVEGDLKAHPVPLPAIGHLPLSQGASNIQLKSLLSQFKTIPLSSYYTPAKSLSPHFLGAPLILEGSPDLGPPAAPTPKSWTWLPALGSRFQSI